MWNLDRIGVLAVCLSLTLSGCGPEGRGSGGGGGGPGSDGQPVVGLDGGGDDGGDDVWVAPEGGDGGAEGGEQGEGGEDAGADGQTEPPDGGEPCEDEGGAQSCGGPVVGTCDPGWRWCVDGAWTDCEWFVGPADEECDRLDNDCDGEVDGEDNGCPAFDDGDPDAAASQREALDRVNEYRAAAGLPIVQFHPALNRAAINHAEYHRENGGSHGEEPGRPGFTGANPGTRAAHEDYDGPPGIFEDMAFGVGPAGAVDMWFHSVYHRVPIVHPDAVVMGFGSHPGAEVLKIAVNGSHAEIHALTPYDGQEDVPRNFHSNREGPDPVPGEGEVGYPISVVTAHGDVGLLHASVRPDAGDDLELYEATVAGPHRGFLNDSVFVMPKQPMAENTWHTVQMSYSAGGRTHERIWRFKTGSFRFR